MGCGTGWLSGQSYHGGGTVPRGRSERCSGACRHRPDGKDTWAIPGHRERRWGRRHDRQRARGGGGSRRIHTARRQHGIACVGARADSQREIRFRARFCADRFHDAIARRHRARKDFPAKDLREFVDYLKKNGDRVKQAHGGIGASSHMACLLFTARADVKPASVAYRGTAPALNDLIGGHVDFFCEQVVSVAPQIAAGAIKAYAISSSERLPRLPGVPTAKEDGLDYQMSIWAGIFAPGGTPKPVVDKLAGALDKTVDDPAVAAKLADLGGSISPKSERTPVQFGRFVKTEIDRWSPILKGANVAEK